VDPSVQGPKKKRGGREGGGGYSSRQLRRAGEADRCYHNSQRKKKRRGKRYHRLRGAQYFHIFNEGKGFPPVGGTLALSI